MNRTASLALIFVLLGAGALVVFLQPQTDKRTPSPPLCATLSFSLNFPKVLVPTAAADVIVHATAMNNDARSVIVKTDSAHVVVKNDPVDVTSGTSADIRVRVEARDARDGAYNAQVWLHFSDSAGAHDTEAKGVSFYIVPYAVLQDVRWAPDFWHPFGKGTIGRSDTTTALFKVLSKSQSVVYEGMVVRAAFTVSAPGLTVTPTGIPIDPIGPQGKSNDYAFAIRSNNTPPGKYTLLFSLYSRDNQLITQETLEITITA